MSELILYVGIAVTFLTIWGVTMVGGYLLGRHTTDLPNVAMSHGMTERKVPAETDRVG